MKLKTLFTGNGWLNKLFKKENKKTPDTDMALEILMLVQEALDNKEDPEQLTASLGRIQQVANRVLGERTPLLTGPHAEVSEQIGHLSPEEKTGMSFDVHEDLTAIPSDIPEGDINEEKTDKKQKEHINAVETASEGFELSAKEEAMESSVTEENLKVSDACKETDKDSAKRQDAVLWGAEIVDSIESTEKDKIIIAENYDEVINILRSVPEKQTSIQEAPVGVNEKIADAKNEHADVQRLPKEKTDGDNKEQEEKPEKSVGGAAKSGVEAAMAPVVETVKPLIEEKEPAEEVPDAEPIQQDRFIGKKVLYAYGNVSEEGLISEVCDAWQIDLDRVANGLAAVRQFSASEPGTYDAIILEKSMPLMNGFMAAKCIRKDKHPESETVPLIVAASGFPVGQIEREMGNISACLTVGTEREIYEVFSNIWKNGDESCA